MQRGGECTVSVKPSLQTTPNDVPATTPVKHTLDKFAANVGKNMIREKYAKKMVRGEIARQLARKSGKAIVVKKNDASAEKESPAVKMSLGKFAQKMVRGEIAKKFALKSGKAIVMKKDDASAEMKSPAAKMSLGKFAQNMARGKMAQKLMQKSIKTIVVKKDDASAEKKSPAAKMSLGKFAQNMVCGKMAQKLMQKSRKKMVAKQNGTSTDQRIWCGVLEPMANTEIKVGGRYRIHLTESLKQLGDKLDEIELLGTGDKWFRTAFDFWYGEFLNLELEMNNEMNGEPCKKELLLKCYQKWQKAVCVRSRLQGAYSIRSS